MVAVSSRVLQKTIALSGFSESMTASRALTRWYSGPVS